MSDHNFIKEYIRDFSEILKPSDDVIEQLILVRDKLLNAKNNNKKIIIFGNGGSAAIASHVSVDMSKNAKLRCLNFLQIFEKVSIRLMPCSTSPI